MADATPPRIVVGVDGLTLARSALEFAIEEAQLRKASLKVTYAYAVMASGVTGSTGHDSYEQVESEAREFIQSLKASAPSTQGVDVEWLAIPGNPSEVLIGASKDAVAGCWLAGRLGLVLGSVSTQCVQHSHCPVLVVREDH